MCVNELQDGQVLVLYISAHTGHDMGAKHLRLPKSTKETIALKLSEGIPTQRIIDDLYTNVHVHVYIIVGSSLDKKICW